MFNKALLVATVATLAFSSAAFAGKKSIDAFADRSTAVEAPVAATEAKPAAKSMHKAKKASKKAKKAASTTETK